MVGKGIRTQLMIDQHHLQELKSYRQKKTAFLTERKGCLKTYMCQPTLEYFGFIRFNTMSLKVTEDKQALYLDGNWSRKYL